MDVHRHIPAGALHALLSLARMACREAVSPHFVPTCLHSRYLGLRYLIMYSRTLSKYQVTLPRAGPTSTTMISLRQFHLLIEEVRGSHYSRAPSRFCSCWAPWPLGLAHSATLKIAGPWELIGDPALVSNAMSSAPRFVSVGYYAQYTPRHLSRRSSSFVPAASYT